MDKEKRRIYMREYARKRRLDPKAMSKEREAGQRYEERNREARAKKSLDYYYSNLEENRLRAKLRQEKIRRDSGITKRSRQPEEIRKEKRRTYRRAYDQKNREAINQKSRDRLKKKRDSSPHYRIKKALQLRIYLVLKGLSRAGRTVEMLGCSIGRFMEYLKAHFQEGMSFNNYGDWHIDHKKPCALFDLAIPEEQRQCFHFTNLQPMWAVDNLRKGKTYGVSP